MHNQSLSKKSMNIEGACFCGRLKYCANFEPENVMLCHCRDCQIFAGTAYRMSGFVRPADFEFTGEQPRIFEKKADSGAIRRMAFCSECGTHMCSLPSDMTDPDAFVSIRIGTADQFHLLKPSAEIFTASRVPWLKGLDGCLEFSAMPLASQ